MTKVTTFYSYKGGSGRSMTMANVAWALATNGERVLAIDWDLEAPGLHRYFHPFLKDPEQGRSEGLVDRIWTYIEQLGSGSRLGHGREGRFQLARCDDVVQTLELPLKTKGCLHLLGAGRQDDQYSAKVGGLDWAGFYARFDGETFVTRLIEWARENYTHILIDSRTGVADTAGICTAQLPDTVVMCVVYNRQSIEGSAAIARSINKTRRDRSQEPLKIRFIPCRVEERGVVEAARRFAAARLGHALDGGRTFIERDLRRNEIRHYPWCAFEEKLAVFEDVPDERGSLLDAMHDLAGQLTDRRTLKIQEIDPKLLASIWRRAAFDDPRIADLEALEEASTDEAISHLLFWLDEALADPGERPDWLMALGEACVSFAARSDGRQGITTAEFLGRSGLEIGRRAIVVDSEQFAIRFALLLQARSGQLQRSQEFDEAFALAAQSYHLLFEEGSPVSRWRAGRSLERMAEINVAKGRPQDALVIHRRLVELYTSLGQRNLPVGAALDAARSLRLLAESLLAHGDPVEAEHIAEQAVRALRRSKLPRSRYDATEVVNILATRADIAAFVGSDTAEHAINLVRRHAEEMIPSPTMLGQLRRRLLVAEARLRMRRGDIGAALELVDRAAELDGHPSAVGNDLFELRIDILLASGRAEEATFMMQRAFRDERFSPSPPFLERLRRSLKAVGREEAFSAEMSELIMKGDALPPTVFSRAVQWLTSPHAKGPQPGINRTTGMDLNRNGVARLTNNKARDE